MSSLTLLPLGVVVILGVLSLRLDKPSWWNFVSVTAIASLAWIIRPEESLGGLAICLLLSTVALGMSPVVSLSRYILRQQSASVDRFPENRELINVLHDPAHAIVEGKSHILGLRSMYTNTRLDAGKKSSFDPDRSQLWGVTSRAAKEPVADSNVSSRHQSLSASVAGLIFLGTPHAGSRYSTLAKLYCLFGIWQGASPQLLAYLSPGSPEIRKLEDSFTHGYRDLSFDYRESKPNLILGMRFEMIVTPQAATRVGHQWGVLDTDHFALNKYASRNDASYTAVAGKISEMLDNWETAKKIKSREIGWAECFQVVEQRLHRESLSVNAHREALHDVLALLEPSSGLDYLVVDALDECRPRVGGEDGSDEKGLQKWFEEIKALPNLQIVITSRTLRQTELLYADDPNIRFKLDERVQNLDADIDRYIQDRMQKPDSGFPQDFSEVVSKLKVKSSVISELGGMDAIGKAIKKGQNFELNRSNRPLGLGLDQRGKDRFRSFLERDLMPLVEILRDDTVRLVHATVAQFILGENIEVEERSSIRVERSESHEFLAVTCVACLRWVLSCEDEVEKPDVLDNEDLHEYAILEWTSHFQESEERIMTTTSSKEAIQHFFGHQAVFDSWVAERAMLDLPFGRQFRRCGRSTQPLALHIASFFGLLRFARLLLKDIDIDACDGAGSTALNVAAGQDRLDMVKMLVQGKARADIADTDSVSPLHKAAKLFDPEVLAYLLDSCQLDVDIRNKDQEAALHLACGRGLAKNASILLQHQASVNATNQLMMTPLHCAVVVGHLDIVRMLVEQGADVNAVDTDGQTALYVASFNGDAAIADLLLANEADANTSTLRRKDTPLHLIRQGVPIGDRDRWGCSALGIAARNEGLGGINALLEAGAVPEFCDIPYGQTTFRPFLKKMTSLNLTDYRGGTPLHIAAESDDTDLVAELISFGVPTTCRDLAGFTPLDRAKSLGHLSVMELIEKAGARLGCPSRNALHWAAEEGRGWESMVGDGSLINVQDEMGRSPLHLAVLSRCFDLVQELLASGAHTELADVLGRTALHCAAAGGDEAITTALLSAKADVDAVDRMRQSPAHLAVTWGTSPVLQILMAAGANLGQDDQGETPLHKAAFRGCAQMCNIILATSNQRFISARDHAGRTALHAAAECEYEDRGTLDAILNASSKACLTNYIGHMAIHIAAHKGHIDVVRMLLDALPGQVKARLSEWETSETLTDLIVIDEVLVNVGALAKDAVSGNMTKEQARWRPDERRQLEKEVVAGLRAFNSGTTVLMEAVDGRQLEMVRFALRNLPETIEARDKFVGWKALHSATLQGATDMMSCLVEAGADVNSAVDTDGDTCLHIAVSLDRADIVDFLLRSHVTSVSNKFGFLPLHLAAGNGNAAMVRSLARVVPVNATDDMLSTALHRACWIGHAEVVRVLVDEGAHVYALDMYQLTPLDYADGLGYETKAYMRERAVDRRRGRRRGTVDGRCH
ncbi:hypothetical protein CDD80_2741 [Ophiocordyceps camponoti-rufipedis]|uniref:Uncharacterized protein n=1 Tax=Ophiocordyceps camponoti-rufipedis TaxID=2004952 RepID=A0A2C5Z568_9HYPO|nr:hypothetical protein CDD80_2741 [Ophiocordyceps camponoti-rufipedis]